MADEEGRATLERNIRYSMGGYYETGDGVALAEKLGNSAQRHVMNAAEHTLVRNARRDRAHPMWALVPHSGACPYCLMLGSRGFEYTSKKTVMAARHDGCGCTPVVDFDRRNPKLRGYDPDLLYRKWKSENGNRPLPYDYEISNRQFSKKFGKHFEEWGLSSSSEEDREEMFDIVCDIMVNAESIGYNDWRSQRFLCEFFIKGDDVVVCNTETKEFVTILKGGVSNERVKNARAAR